MERYQWLTVTTCPAVNQKALFAVPLGPIAKTSPLRPCAGAYVSDLWVTCYHPIQAWPGPPGHPQAVFQPQRSYKGAQPFSLPCGRCIGCRMAKAKDWATRMHHEASLHDDNSFVTLTYSDDCLPTDGSLSLRELQLFFKRLRKAAGSVRIRYFAAGEYGDLTWRPHYHLILFGWAFSDLEPWRRTPNGHLISRSPLLERLWPFGHSEVGSVTHQSAGYVARYCLKKMNGEKAETHYCRPHPLTGQFWRVVPEFAVMSRRPGIGSGWFDQYASDAFPSDFVTVNGQKTGVPRFYRSKLEGLASVKIMAKRKMAAFANAANSTPDRLSVREELQTLRARSLKRTLGDSDQ